MVQIVEKKIKVIENVPVDLDENLKRELIEQFDTKSEEDTKIEFLTNKLSLEGDYKIVQDPQSTRKSILYNLDKERIITSMSVPRIPYQLLKNTKFTVGDLKYDDILMLVGHYKIINREGEVIAKIGSGPGKNLLELITDMCTPIGVKYNIKEVTKKAIKKIDDEGLVLEDPYEIAKSDKTPVNLLLNQYLSIQHSKSDFKLKLGLEPILSCDKMFQQSFVKENFYKEWEKIREYMKEMNKIGNQNEMVNFFNRAYKSIPELIKE